MDKWYMVIEQMVNCNAESRGKLILRDGVLYIERNGHVYNANGAQIR